MVIAKRGEGIELKFDNEYVMLNHPYGMHKKKA